MESTSLDREPEETPSSSSVKERWAFSITISFSQQDVAVNMGKTPTFEVKWWRGTFLTEICCLFHRGLQQDQEHLIRGVEWQQIWCRAHATRFLVQHQYHRRAFPPRLFWCVDVYVRIPPRFLLFVVASADNRCSPTLNYFCHDCIWWENRRPTQKGWCTNTADLQDFSLPAATKDKEALKFLFFCHSTHWCFILSGGTEVQRHEWRQGPPFDDNNCLLSLPLICIEVPWLWLVLCSDTEPCNHSCLLWLMKWSVVLPCRFFYLFFFCVCVCVFVFKHWIQFFGGRAKWIFISPCQAFSLNALSPHLVLLAG